ncbi:hypothetical protein CR513_08541, partial [Mucuna pruriens]
MEQDIFYVHEKILSKSLTISHVPAQEQVVEILTKSLAKAPLSLLKDKLKVLNVRNLREKRRSLEGTKFIVFSLQFKAQDFFTVNIVFHEHTKHIKVDCDSIRKAYHIHVISLPHILTSTYNFSL